MIRNCQLEVSQFLNMTESIEEGLVEKVCIRLIKDKDIHGCFIFVYSFVLVSKLKYQPILT